MSFATAPAMLTAPAAAPSIRVWVKPPRNAPSRRRSALLPRLKRYSIPFFLNNRQTCMMLTIVWQTSWGWEGGPDYGNPQWRTIPVGPFVLALRVEA